MVLGLGIDLVELARIEGVLLRRGESFKARVYTVAERALGDGRGGAATAFYAGRWAAKEAVAKALGTGFGKDCGWQDVDITSDATGRPCVTLHGPARARADLLGVERIHVSITHERAMACAMAVLEGTPPA